MRIFASILAAAVLCACSAPAFSRSAHTQSLQTGVNSSPSSEGRSVSSGFGPECKELSKSCVQEQINGQAGDNCGQYRQHCQQK